VSLTFEVLGTPVPKGSARAFVPKGWKRPIVTNDNPKTKPWQESIVSAAHDALAGGGPIEREEPVALLVRFFMPRPKSAPKRVVEPTTIPDLDKLVRTVKDGLKRGGIYRDDSQVTLTLSTKAFAGGASDPAGPTGVPRAIIEVGLRAEVLVALTWPGAGHHARSWAGKTLPLFGGPAG